MVPADNKDDHASNEEREKVSYTGKTKMEVRYCHSHKFSTSLTFCPKFQIIVHSEAMARNRAEKHGRDPRSKREDDEKSEVSADVAQDQNISPRCRHKVRSCVDMYS